MKEGWREGRGRNGRKDGGNDVDGGEGVEERTEGVAKEGWREGRKREGWEKGLRK